MNYSEIDESYSAEPLYVFSQVSGQNIATPYLLQNHPAEYFSPPSQVVVSHVNPYDVLLHRNEPVSIGDSPRSFEEVSTPTTVPSTLSRRSSFSSCDSDIIILDGKRYAICPLCDRLLLHKNLQSHVLNHDENRTRDYKCAVCEKDYLHKRSLASHIRKVHLSDKSYFHEEFAAKLMDIFLSDYL